MNMETIAQTLQGALQIPVYPAPIRKLETCAAYKIYPAENDGMREDVRIAVCIFAPTYAQAYDLTTQLTTFLVQEGEDAGEYHYTRTGQDSQCGKVGYRNWYYVKTTFACVGRGR